MTFTSIKNIRALPPHEATHVALCAIIPAIINGVLAGLVYGLQTALVVGIGIVSIMMGMLAFFFAGKEAPSSREIGAIMWVMLIVAMVITTAGFFTYSGSP